jgi:hypothetical protein
LGEVTLGGGGGRSEAEAAVVGVIERGEEVSVGGMEVSVGEESRELRLELGLPPPWTTNGLTTSIMLVVSVKIWSEATS